MPSLRPTPKVNRVYLPSTQDLPENERAWIDVKDSLELGDIAALATAGAEPEALTLAGIARMIVEWNIEDLEDVDNDGKPKIAAINSRTVNRLNPKDFGLITEKFYELMAQSQEGLDEGEKKDSTGSSPVEATKEPSQTQTSTDSPTSQKTTIPISV